VPQVLDTATGLGYTAIAASKCEGVSEVVTVEYDHACFELCRHNPWSSELFTGPNIKLLRGDVCELIGGFSEGSFSAVVHDPPALSLCKSTNLYSTTFYAELYRVLRWRGKLFHHVGNPNNKATDRLYRATIQKLESVGFKKCMIVACAHGIVAEKGEDRKSKKGRLAEELRRKKRKNPRAPKWEPFIPPNLLFDNDGGDVPDWD
jgi:uncharacterized protein